MIGPRVMASTGLHKALERFAGELRGLTGRVSESIGSLKRGAESRPHAGVDAFRENLEDLEGQVADIAAEAQQLERVTTEAVCLEELLGHFVELYHSNRAGAALLVAHLERYGYQQPAGARPEPEDPCSGGAASAAPSCSEFCFEDGDEDADPTAHDVPRQYRHGAASASTSPVRRPLGQSASRSLPASPVSAALLSSGYVPSRLGIGQPGSPMRGGAAAAAAAAAFTLGAPPSAAAPRTAAGKLSAPAPRPSMGAASNATLTPEGLALLSPGLASKYACPSSGAPSEPGPGSGAVPPCDLPPGGNGLPAQGAGARARAGACRDLRLDYGRCSSDSPNLPIFGVTPRSASLPASTVEGLPEAPASGTASLGGCGGPPGASPLPGDAANCTGDLYDMLIRSNMGPAGADDTPPDAPAPPPHVRTGGGPQGRDGGSDEEEEEEGRGEAPARPSRPTTPGRSLPAGWHEAALQELESLSLTLSQMKRTPSRSRLAAALSSGDDGDGGAGGGGGGWGARAEAWEAADENRGSGGAGTAPEAPAAAREPLGAAPAPTGVLQQRQDQDAAASPPRRGPGADGEGKKHPAIAAAAAAAAQTPGTPTTRAAARRQQQLEAQQKAVATATGAGSGAVAPVGAEEFAALPAWCSRQLSLAELNAALEGLARARTAPSDGGDAAVSLDTLGALGFDAAKARAVFNCLSKLGRAAPQRAAGGGAVAYRLVAAPR
ncbi:hypothetical protein Rsub_12127 [Raphidocelis subcapitata]|uniref:Uncharacterized protein n=1 Tax=Raphidocelis subcapitata TaxID=307507 RepID=A0A2V0PMP0_9CHLO|nr:hypothetical protein Rsub_12127 [Raphidocelis subcapitata]|eukprot:GBF99160.1 hypothetical protein Rsub_12127 [Raphidocelis subcapitata]